MSTDKKAGLTTRIRDIGITIFGETVGSAIGMALAEAGGPLGSVAVQTGVSGAIQEWASRFLSKREEQRVATAMVFALERIQERLNNGDKFRADGFFEPNTTGQSKADEIVEGVLQKCKNEFAEKKLRYLGNIIANTPFHYATAETLHRVIVVAERMSYRQMQLLALVARCKELNFPTKLLKKQPSLNSANDSDVLHGEVEAMHEAGFRLLIHIDVQNTRGQFGAMPSGLGQLCYELMGLEAISKEELSALALPFLTAS